MQRERKRESLDMEKETALLLNEKRRLEVLAILLFIYLFA